MADVANEMKKNGRPEWAEAFAAGYRNAKLKGACAALIEVLKKESQREYVSPNEMARYYGIMGDRDHTFEWLEKGYAERSSRMEYLKIEDALSPFTPIHATSTCSNAWACRSDDSFAFGNAEAHSCFNQISEKNSF